MQNLKEIARILRQAAYELQQANDELERKYGQSNVLRPSNDGATPTRGDADEQNQL